MGAGLWFGGRVRSSGHLTRRAADGDSTRADRGEAEPADDELGAARHAHGGGGEAAHLVRVRVGVRVRVRLRLRLRLRVRLGLGLGSGLGVGIELAGARPRTARAAPVSCRVPVAQPQSARYSVTVCSPPMGGGSAHCREVSLSELRLAHAVSPTWELGSG